jgi:hypothetical protein
MAAPALIEFANKEIERHDGKYVPWDTYLSHRLRRLMDVPTYIPFKQYGEHGGSPNQEHKNNKIRNWHQADILADRLAFLPQYAKGNPLTYRLIRVRANLRGLARIIFGKYIEPTSFKVSNQKIQLIKFTLCRWLTRRKTFRVFNTEN